MKNGSSSSKHPTRATRSVGPGKLGHEVQPASLPRRDSDKPAPVPVRIILADSETIFRVGMTKVFAVESDLEVVAQTETLPETLNAAATIPADVILYETGLSPKPAEAVSEIARRALPGAKVVLVTQHAGEEETVDYLRRGVQGILNRAISPELLVRCVRKVAAGEAWLDKQSVNWVIQAYRTQALEGTGPKQQALLSKKEMLIISGVTQGLKNRDIAREIGTTEQVIKNYLSKLYHKLPVTDRLDLAFYTINHRLLEGYVPEPRRALCNAEDSGKTAEAVPTTTPS